MPKTRQQKEAELNAFQEKLSALGSGILFWVNYRGLNVGKLSELRRQVKKSGGALTVIKKTLARLAFREKNIEVDPTTFDGEVGFVFGAGDALATAKAVYQFSRREEKPVILGGWFEGRALTAEGVVALATLPPRQVLLGQVVGTLSVPLRGLMRTCAEIMGSLVKVVSLIKS